MKLKQIIRINIFCAALAVCLTFAWLSASRVVAGKAFQPASLRGAAALNQLKQDGQHESLQDAIQQARLSVSRAEQTPLGREAWHAPNPTAGYNAYITESGVSIAVNDQSYVSLSLHSLGYGHAMRAVEPGKVSGDKQTIEVVRDHGVREWYVNRPEGLEQGFTIGEPLGARHYGAPLRLAMQVSDGWRAAASEDGKAVILRGADAMVEYGKLAVSDSEGRIVPARLTIDGEQVVIEVEDHEAVYPLTIDPVFTMQQKLTAADAGNGDYFGYAVALSNNTVAVGAYQDDIGAKTDQGSVYVFTRNGATWTLQQKITAGDGAAFDKFGWATALYGDTLAVGLEDNAGSRRGAAYVFARSGGVWSLQQKITAFDGAADDAFGKALALSDYTLVVGALGDDIGSNDSQGSAYVYTRIGATWTLQKKLFAGDGAAFDLFGGAVAISGDTVVVGARRDNIGANEAQGSAYVYQRYGTIWLLEKKLTAYDGGYSNVFGSAVAISGDTAVVGAPGHDIGVNSDQGAAYVFARSGGVWTLQHKLTANDGGNLDRFGNAVAVSGDMAVVGASSAAIGTNWDQGAAYVFTRSGAIWTQIKKLTASDGTLLHNFGNAVALSSDTLVVGASGDNLGTTFNQGSVYVYAISPCPTLTLLPDSLPGGAVGSSYQQFLLVSGGAGPFEFTLVGGALPPGLSLTDYGKLSGPLTALGVYQFTIRATSQSSFCFTDRTYTITVTDPCSAITIEPATLPDGLVDRGYSETLTATGGKEPYTFSAGGMLPPGLSLSADGILKGTPTQPGSFSFRVTVRDYLGCYGAQSYTMKITKEEAKTGVASRARRSSR